MRKHNWWNTWQHYRKLAKSGGWGRWAFNFIKAFIPKDKLERYERVGQ